MQSCYLTTVIGAVVLDVHESWSRLRSSLKDWRTMINHLKERKSIDSRRIVLWGTALSGGYVLDIAAEFKNVQAVMAQVPFVDGAASAKLYPLQQLPKALKTIQPRLYGWKSGHVPDHFTCG